MNRYSIHDDMLTERPGREVTLAKFESQIGIAETLFNVMDDLRVQYGPDRPLSNWDVEGFANHIAGASIAIDLIGNGLSKALATVKSDAELSDRDKAAKRIDDIDFHIVTRLNDAIGNVNDGDRSWLKVLGAIKDGKKVREGDLDWQPSLQYVPEHKNPFMKFLRGGMAKVHNEAVAEARKEILDGMNALIGKRRATEARAEKAQAARTEYGVLYQVVKRLDPSWEASKKLGFENMSAQIAPLQVAKQWVADERAAKKASTKSNLKVAGGRDI